MGAARWVVIGTALAAAATATYMLMGPSPQTGTGGTQRSVTDPVDSPDVAPQDQIDAESRDAMRSFLRQSVQESVQEPVEESAREDEAMKRDKELDW